MNWCVVIPTYNNCNTLGNVIRDVLQITENVICVNDGSTDRTSAVLSEFPAIEVVSYHTNKGKGYALKKGFEKARSGGFDYAVTIDADGQHYASDIPLLIQKSEEVPGALIVGSRTLPEEKLRRGSGFANRFSNFWFRIIAGVSLPDSQSGLRLYPLKPLDGMKFYSNKYEFELEVLYRAAWKDIRLASVPIRVFYPEKSERISHFRPVRDFFRIGVLNTICVLFAFLYVKPFWLFRNLRKENIRSFVRNNVIHANDSIAKMTLSVMLGVFMGIVPIWGYQLITAIALAYLFRLNKLLVIVAANISIFPFTAVILYLSYITGGIVLSSGSKITFNMNLSLAGFGSSLFQYIIGAIVLACVASLFFGMLTYIILRVARRKPAIVN